MNPTRKCLRIFRISLLSFLLLIATLLIDSNTRIVTTEYELHYPNLPSPFDGFRIIVLADIHDTEYGKDNKRLISRVHKAKPDIIIVAGDWVNARGRKRSAEEQFESIEALADGLTPIAPVYFINGNHELSYVLGDPEILLSLLKEHGVNTLCNEYVKIEANGASIILAGTNDRDGPSDMIKPDEFVKEIYDAEGDAFVILAEHRNENLPLYSGLGIDLVLCGHSHGGVIRLPFTDGLISPYGKWFPTYTSGVYTMGETNMLVSRGLGNPTNCPRFLNNPHIAVAVLRYN